MSEPLCRPCGDSGQSVLAHRMVGKTPMCDSHFRSAMGMPAATNGDTPMPVKKLINEGTKAAIRADAESGMSVEQIRKKHAVSWYNAKTIIDGGNGGGNGNKAAGGGQSSDCGETGSRDERAFRGRAYSAGNGCGLERAAA